MKSIKQIIIDEYYNVETGLKSNQQIYKQLK